LEQKRPQRARSQRTRSGQTLRQYRLYFLHSVERLISYCHEFEAEDEGHAVHIAEGWREGRRAELWEGSHKLKAWEADN
jgi:hypothetical protein